MTYSAGVSEPTRCAVREWLKRLHPFTITFYGCATHWERVPISKLLSFACVPCAAIYNSSQVSQTQAKKAYVYTWLVKTMANRIDSDQHIIGAWSRIDNLNKPAFRKRNGIKQTKHFMHFKECAHAVILSGEIVRVIVLSQGTGKTRVDFI